MVHIDRRTFDCSFTDEIGRDRLWFSGLDIATLECTTESLGDLHDARRRLPRRQAQEQEIDRRRDRVFDHGHWVSHASFPSSPLGYVIIIIIITRGFGGEEEDLITTTTTAL